MTELGIPTPPFSSTSSALTTLSTLNTLDAYDFSLPDELIAQTPAAHRTASRLLDLSEEQTHEFGRHIFKDRIFKDLPMLLRAGDLLVFNDTKVIKARLHGEKSTGGKVEALIERVDSEYTAIAQIKASKSPKPESKLTFSAHSASYSAMVEGRVGDFYILKFEAPVLNVLDEIGLLPLPPYITHAATEEDQTRYQTVYAKELGAVAAPTAGLHFDDGLLETLRAQGVDIAFVTLHVGAGTFQPVRTDKISEHVMHSERYRIPPETAEKIAIAKSHNKRVVAVGTTSMRTLEGAFAKHGSVHAIEDETNIFITPGYRFNVVDTLITNFHLPKSTLMMLVTAFGGYERLMRAYEHAIKERYRFFSFGDAMFINRADS